MIYICITILILQSYRQGTYSIKRVRKLTEGMKLTTSNTITTKLGYKSSLTASLSASAFGATIGAAATHHLSHEIRNSITTTEERYWSREEKVTFTIPAGIVYRVMQINVQFNSLLAADDGVFRSHYRTVQNKKPCYGN